MSANHRVSANGHDRYHGVVKAKELRSQNQHEHGNMRVWEGKEGSKHEPQSYGNADSKHGGRPNYDGRRDLAARNGDSHPWPGKTDGHDHRNIDHNGRNRNYDHYNFRDRDLSRRDEKGFSHGGHKFPHMHGPSHDALRGVKLVPLRPMPIKLTPIKLVPIRITHASIFRGMHLGSFDKSHKAQQDFLKNAVGFLKNPSDKSYKALNDSMMKLMDPRFTPAITGGAAKINIRDVRGMTMVRVSMYATPAPVKTLDEAREALKNAYSTKRDGEKGIADIRTEAYTDYIRALSENYKNDGVIKHTNHTPTTPVFKSSVIYVLKVTQINTPHFHQIQKPQFDNRHHGNLHFKNNHGFWNNQRHNAKSHVDLIKNHSKPSRLDHDFKTRKSIEAKHDGHNSKHGKTDKTGHKNHGHHGGAKAGKAS